jgi:hypothetical protein
LIATTRSRLIWRALQTEPWPPLPIASTIS